MAFIPFGRASGSGAPPLANVTLAWNPSTNKLVAGFNLYYGGVSGTYTNKTAAGAATSLTISNLIPGTTCYFAATTYRPLVRRARYPARCLTPCPVHLPECS